MSEIEITPNTRPDDLPVYLKASEVAAFLRINRKTVYVMRNRGDLIAKKVGSDLRFFRDSVLQSSSGNIVSHSRKKKI